MKKIAILGAGGFGIAIAATCDMIGHEVSVWSLFEKEVQALETNRCNNKLLPGVMLSDRVNVTGDLSVVDTADVVIIAVPSFAVRSTAALAASHIKADTVVVNVAKGLEVDENGNFYRLSEVISQEIDSQNIVVMTGPTITVQEIRRLMPNTRIDGQLAPFTFMRNDEDAIIAEVKRDCEAAKENDLRGLNFTTAGSINNGSSLQSMRVVMAAIQNFGRY